MSALTDLYDSLYTIIHINMFFVLTLIFSLAIPPTLASNSTALCQDAGELAEKGLNAMGGKEAFADVSGLRLSAPKSVSSCGFRS